MGSGGLQMPRELPTGQLVLLWLFLLPRKEWFAVHSASQARMDSAWLAGRGALQLLLGDLGSR